MNDQAAEPVIKSSSISDGLDLEMREGPLHGYGERLANDLTRLLRYASTSKEVDISKDILEAATTALRAAKLEMIDGKPPSAETELDLFKAVDSLSPKVYPATIASLVGRSRCSFRGRVQIRPAPCGVISASP